MVFHHFLGIQMVHLAWSGWYCIYNAVLGTLRRFYAVFKTWKRMWETESESSDNMTWFTSTDDAVSTLDAHLFRDGNHEGVGLRHAFPTLTCPSCAHPLHFQLQGGLEDWGRAPAGVKFDPSDQQILEHLQAKVKRDERKLHPLIDEFIPTLEGDDGICYTHPQNLPGMRQDGQIRHFFHRPSKAYTAGTRKRRKVKTDEEGTDIRWHKTGKTRPITDGGGGGVVIGFKKILVLYSNRGNQRKPQKTNWIMHQYHLGVTEHEKDGQLVASKAFFQKQTRQSSSYQNPTEQWGGGHSPETSAVFVDCSNPMMSSNYM